LHTHDIFLSKGLVGHGARKERRNLLVERNLDRVDLAGLEVDAGGPGDAIEVGAVAQDKFESSLLLTTTCSSSSTTIHQLDLPLQALTRGAVPLKGWRAANSNETSVVGVGHSSGPGSRVGVVGTRGRSAHDDVVEWRHCEG